MASPFQTQTGSAQALRNQVNPVTLPSIPVPPAGVIGPRADAQAGWMSFMTAWNEWRHAVSQQLTAALRAPPAADQVAALQAQLAAMQVQINALSVEVDKLKKP